MEVDGADEDLRKENARLKEELEKTNNIIRGW